MQLTRRLFPSFKPRFATKVRWRMAQDRNPLFLTIQDKYQVRAYAAERSVATADLLYVTQDPQTIPFETLPESYFIKASHGWGWNILCLQGEFYHFKSGTEIVDADGSLKGANVNTEHPLSQDEVVALCIEWMGQTHRSDEWAYQHIEPQIIVEALLNPQDDTELKDYRMYTFDGVVKAISIGSARYRRDARNIFFDRDWNEFILTRYQEARPEHTPQRPERLDAMLAAVERLGAGLDFVRIDLYDTTAGIVLGEMTIYPQGGSSKSPTTCPAFNQWLGDQWQLGWRNSCQALLLRRSKRRRQRSCNGNSRAVMTHGGIGDAMDNH
jgi:hypothetical protein